MDQLDEQLRQLSIINNRSLQRRGGGADETNVKTVGTNECVNGKVAALIKLASDTSSTANDDSNYIRNLRKVAPSVPPKPHKKRLDFPQVPQSRLVVQSCEPLYSRPLQCVESSSLLTTTQPLIRKPATYLGGTNSLYDKTSKVSLDNPAILEQQLEALAYHKQQLEKKGLLNLQQQIPVTHHSSIPKLSSPSFSQNDHPNTIYTNIRQNTGISIDSNEKTANSMYQVDNIDNRKKLYSNLIYENSDRDLPPLLPTQTATSTNNELSIANDGAGYLDHHSNGQEEDIPPPPSPVSSSYSELRRAIDVFAKSSAEHNEMPNNVNCTPYEEQRHIPKNTKLASIESAAQKYGQKNYVYSPVVQSVSQDSSDYYGYGNFSQSSSTYESIYEPINPRPPSGMSTRSNYLIYTPFVNDPQNPGSANFNTSGTITPMYPTVRGGIYNNDMNILLSGQKNINQQKEVEVEALTDYLVHSMDTANDVENYGKCYKCNERVLGENNGCTAMDQIYHISCFTCCQCQINLQGKPFYVLEGKPFCEYDYLQTLEKCSVCMKPILERILRATGKPYHPQCFTCIVCGHSLDGIPFTVDATNQNYCITDFHKKFAPRCCVCKEPIMPESGQEETVRVVALDRSFHFKCYKCEDCGLLLSSEAEGRGCYPLDDHVLCKSCNAKRVQLLTNRMTTEL